MPWLALLLTALAQSTPNIQLDAAVRVSGAIGHLKELTMALPTVELSGTVVLEDQAFVELRLGYGLLDNHTFLADGRVVSGIVVAGVHLLNNSLRLGAGLGADWIAFYADPDAIMEYGEIALLERRGGLVPAAQLEGAYRLGMHTSIGLFSKISLRSFQLLKNSRGQALRAHLRLVGLFIEVRLR